MSDMDSTFSLDDLARISGEKPRTIRSWIRQGLLPPARGGGRGSYYDQEHVDRLGFVVQLRKKAGARLPTSVIRDVLHQLLGGADPDVVRRVARGEEPLEVADLFGAFDGRASSAAQPPMQSMRSQASVRFEELDDDELGQEELDGASHRVASSYVPSAPSGSQRRGEPRWTTIQIREDLELRLASDDPERVAWLARIARRLRALLDAEAEP